MYTDEYTDLYMLTHMHVRIHKVSFCVHWSYIRTLHIWGNALHADFLFPSQLTYATHTKCPLPLYMNNTNVFSSSPPSWKTRSVSEPLTLACGCTSMWQWNTESSSTERECVRAFAGIYVCAHTHSCVCAHTLMQKTPFFMLWGIGSRSIKLLYLVAVLIFGAL